METVQERVDEGNGHLSGLHCAVLIARFLGVAVDYADLHHQFGHQYASDPDLGLLRALKYLKLKTKQRKVRVETLADLHLPVITQRNDGEYFILAAIKDDKVLIQNPADNKPTTLALADFEESWNHQVFLVTKRSLLPGISGKFDFSWFIPAIIKYKKLLSEVLVASFFIQLFALVTPLFFQVIIDKVLVHKGLTTLDVLAIGLLVVSLFEVVLSGLRTYLFSHTTNRIDVSLGARLYHHLLSLPIAYFEARRVGDSVARVRELENIRNFLTGSALTLVIDLFFTIVFLVVMYYYSPTLCYVVLGSIPFYIILSIVITPVLRKRLNEKFARGAENQAFLVESVTGVQTVKALSVEPQLQKHWEDNLAEYVRTAFRASNLGNIASQFAGFINKVTVVLILWIGAHLVIEGSLSVGQLVAFNMLAGRVSGPVLRLVQLWQDFQQAGISVERLGDILNTPTERSSNTSMSCMPAMQGHIQFHHVSFRYRPDAAEALKNISLEIKQGEIIGFVGPSGSGKSTLTKLVQRLYIPESGRVSIDGADLAVIDPVWLRRQIGVVLQENYLFNRTVRDNIAVAELGMSNTRVIQAAKLAGAHDFILELPEGYDTMVGEQGSTLSGGQRQRIAIARALVMNPKVLILDEATSALDYESERIIQNNMQQICKGRTVLIIAHRLSTVRNTNRIIVIDKGHMVEQGSHKQLLEQDGHYSRLYQYQYGEKA